MSRFHRRPPNDLGKTSEAKGDLARLQEVRRRREAAAKQREAEAAGGDLLTCQGNVADAKQRPLERQQKRRKRPMRGGCRRQAPTTSLLAYIYMDMSEDAMKIIYRPRR